MLCGCGMCCGRSREYQCWLKRSTDTCTVVVWLCVGQTIAVLAEKIYRHLYSCCVAVLKADNSSVG